MRNLRQAARGLGRDRGFTLTAVAALALGIGASLAMCSLVDAVFLRPLPYHDPERLCVLWEDASHYGFPRDTPAPANFLDWQAQSQSFSSMAASETTRLNLSGAGDPAVLSVTRVSPNLLELLGTPPLLGRGFSAADDAPGAPPVALLSYRLWTQRFARETGVVGRAITLDGRLVTVIGVMPAGFAFPSPETDAWLASAWDLEQRSDRQNHYLFVVGRLREETTLAAAQAELAAIAQRLAKAYPETNQDLGASVVGLREHVSGAARAGFLALSAAVGFLLLISGANVSNLLLARAARRAGEMAVRQSLGARAVDLLIQHVAEAGLLCTGGALLGLGVAAALQRAFGGLVPSELGPLPGFELSPRLLAALVGLCALLSMALGAVATGWMMRHDLAPALRAGGRSVARRSSARRGFLVAQMALSLCLLVGAGLLTRSLLALLATPLGFEPRGAFTLRTELPASKYQAPAARQAFFERVREGVRSLPGVQASGFASQLPLSFGGDNNTFLVEGEAIPAPGREHIVSARVVTPGYFPAAGMALSAGRDFDGHDGPEAEPVVIVSATLARRFFPGGEAVGKRLHRGTTEPPLRWLKVVGVVDDVRQESLEQAARPELYLSSAQHAGFYFVPRHLVVRAATSAAVLEPAVRRIVHELDPDQPVSAAEPLQGVVSHSLARRQLQAQLLMAFAVAALLLASVGVYGVFAFDVAERSREFGVRLALGAAPGTILRLVLRESARLTLVGVGLGLAGALGAGRLLASLLYGVAPSDPPTLLLSALVLPLAALAACAVPAWRAARVEPISVLRSE
jgi:predicted permease